MGLCQQDLGTQGLGAVAILGGTLSTGADEEGGQDHQEAPVGYPECYRSEGQQWTC